MRFASVAISLVAFAGGPATAQQPPLVAPHARDPVAGSLDDDPVLRLGRSATDAQPLIAAVRDTVARAPASTEAEATAQEAGAALAEARAVRSPSLDLAITSYQVIDRRFGNSVLNVIERARPNGRTDLLVSADQLLMDAGGASNRIGAARERLRAAEYDVLSTQDRTALQTIGAWYDVFTFRALANLADAFVASQGDLRGFVQQRIDRGASAPADLARVDSYLASARTRLARFRRQQAQAEARYAALTGAPPPADLSRAEAPAAPISRELALARAAETPAVRGARAAATASQRDAKAARADTLPTLSAGIESGRYGIYETPRDYDIRGRVTIRQRLFGGVDARADQARARAVAADARATRTEQDAARDASVAWSDVQLLGDQERALRDTYVASRRSRDVVAERFRVSSGTLFDVLGSEDNYFETAASYVQAVTELDAARWVLLSRTGTLLTALGIPAPPRSYRP